MTCPARGADEEDDELPLEASLSNPTTLVVFGGDFGGFGPLDWDTAQQGPRPPLHLLKVPHAIPTMTRVGWSLCGLQKPMG